MPYFAYSGPDNSFLLRGLLFNKGEPREVVDTSVVDKCRALSYFDEVHTLAAKEPTEAGYSIVEAYEVPPVKPAQRKRGRPKKVVG